MTCGLGPQQRVVHTTRVSNGGAGGCTVLNDETQHVALLDERWREPAKTLLLRSRSDALINGSPFSQKL